MRKYALPIFFGAIVLLLLFDVILASFGGSGASISAQVYDVSHRYLAIPYAFGVLSAHLFLPPRGDRANANESP